MNRGAALLALALVLFVAGPAAADPPDRAACGRAYQQAQRLRQARELKSARTELLVCSRPECTWMRRDCGQWLADVEAAMPSVVIVARGADGAPRRNVRVTIDGNLVSEHLSDEPLALDPGEHVIALDADGVARVQQTLSLREGEQGRRIEVTFAAAAPSPPPPSPPPRLVMERPVPLHVYLLGAAGIASAGVGAYFQLRGMSMRSDLDACDPRCAPAAVDDARTTLWIGNAGLIVGAVALAGAVVLYFVRPTVARSASLARVLEGSF